MDGFEEFKAKVEAQGDMCCYSCEPAFEAGQASMRAATTPVIEAAERIKSFQYEEIEYPSRKPAAPYSENEFMERAFNDGLDYCAAIVEAALATYRETINEPTK